MAGPYWAIIAWCWVVFWVYWTVSGLRIRAPRRKASLAFTILNTALLYAGFVLVLVGRSGYRTARDSLHVRSRLQLYRRDSVRGRGCCARHLVAAGARQQLEWGRADH